MSTEGQRVATLVRMLRAYSPHSRCPASFSSPVGSTGTSRRNAKRLGMLS